MKLIQGDCLEVMKTLPDNSVDAIITDLPYGTTACKWDVVIPFEPMWAQVKRVIKDNGAIVLFGSEPFSSYLRLSNIKDYKYDWKWDKKQCGNPFLAKIQPLKTYEDIMVFNSKKYYPIMRKGKLRKKGGCKKDNSITGTKANNYSITNDTYYPIAILDFTNANKKGKQHPTQKPVALMEYLIKTYTNEGDTVLDFCMGSGTTGVACVQTGRDFIGIEKDQTYFETSKRRIEDTDPLFQAVGL